MQLFRVKDCKQMAKKKADGISPSARFHIYRIQYQYSCIGYLLGGLALIIFLFNRFGGVRHSRTLSRYHYDALFWGDYSVKFRAPRFLGGGGLPLALRNAVLIYIPHHCCEWAVIILSVICWVVLP